jgi:hypothetical protein
MKSSLKEEQLQAILDYSNFDVNPLLRFDLKLQLVKQGFFQTSEGTTILFTHCI